MVQRVEGAHLPAETTGQSIQHGAETSALCPPLLSTQSISWHVAGVPQSCGRDEGLLGVSEGLFAGSGAPPRRAALSDVTAEAGTCRLAPDEPVFPS